MYEKIKNSRLTLPALIVCAAIAAMYPVLFNGFIYWDDYFYVYGNNSVQAITFDNLKEILFNHHRGLYKPLPLLTFMAEWFFVGAKPFLYHLDNLLLHCVNAVLVYAVFLKTLKNKTLAFIVAVFFAIHPAHVESVAAINERKDMLYALFWNIGFLTYFKFTETGHKKYYIYTLIALILSLFSKPMGITFPAVLAIIECYNKGTFSVKAIYKACLKQWPFFVICIGFALFTMLLLSKGAVFFITEDFYPRHVQILCGLYGVLLYLGNLLFPINLSCLYPYPMLFKGYGIIDLYLTPVKLAAIFGALFYFGRKSKEIIFGTLFFIITVFPAIQFRATATSLAFDHYTYIPYCGLFIIIGLFIEKLRNTNPKKAIAIFLAMCIFYGVLANIRARAFKNDITLATDAINKNNENHIAYLNRIDAYKREKMNEEALADYKIFVELMPYEEAFAAAAELAIELKHYNDSLEFAEKGLTFYPANRRLLILKTKAQFLAESVKKE